MCPGRGSFCHLVLLFGLQPYLWKGANSQVQGDPWSGAKLRSSSLKWPPGSHMPSNRVRGMEQLLLLKPPEHWIRSPEFPGSISREFCLAPVPRTDPIPVLAFSLASPLSDPEAGKHPSLCLEKPTAPLRNSSNQALHGEPGQKWEPSALWSLTRAMRPSPREQVRGGSGHRTNNCQL